MNGKGANGMFKRVIAATALLAVVLAGSARAEVPALVRIGMMNDMPGSYSDNAGAGSVVAAQIAADEFMASHPASRSRS